MCARTQISRELSVAGSQRLCSHPVHFTPVLPLCRSPHVSRCSCHILFTR
jgi:hypothetical protein